MMNWISDLWCRKMHSKAMWPIHGKYICPQCFREHRVAWDAPARQSEYATLPARKPEMQIATTPSVVN